MRLALIALPLLLGGAPALAQQAAQPPLHQPPLQVPPELTDPTLAGRLAAMSQALGRALLNLPVGEVEAIAQGRQPTTADRSRTIRDSDPDLSRDLQQKLAQAGPMMELSMKALSAALPAMLKSLQQASEAIDRAAANLPSPTYPKR